MSVATYTLYLSVILHGSAPELEARTYGGVVYQENLMKEVCEVKKIYLNGALHEGRYMQLDIIPAKVTAFVHFHCHPSDLPLPTSHPQGAKPAN